MSRLKCLSAVTLIVVLTWTATGRPVAAQPPDLILHNGKIATVDAAFSLAEAIAIRGERIVAVGKNDDVLATKGEATKLVDLGGKLVLPSSMLHLATHLSPSYVIVSPFALEPMMVIDELEVIQRASLYVSSADEVTPRPWGIDWAEFLRAIRRFFSRRK